MEDTPLVIKIAYIVEQIPKLPSSNLSPNSKYLLNLERIKISKTTLLIDHPKFWKDVKQYSILQTFLKQDTKTFTETSNTTQQ